jgi:peptidoglycan/xylan/chitin deacetylase (PgdA/CDA1 family)
MKRADSLKKKKKDPHHSPCPWHMATQRAVPWKKDSDPALASDASPLLILLNVIVWTLLSFFWRLVAPLLFPKSTRCFYDVRTAPGVHGLIALTIDDCFCRQGDERCSLIAPLLELLSRHNAKATFFLTLEYSQGPWRERQIREVVAEGHELANHGEEDREYDRDSAESFERALMCTDAFIRRMSDDDEMPRASETARGAQTSARRARSPPVRSGVTSTSRRRTTGATDDATTDAASAAASSSFAASNTADAPTNPTRWFRAPSASLSNTMDAVLARRGFTHVLTDSYANDPHVPFPRWVAWAMDCAATHGSILVLHMPELGFREWDLEAIDRVLDRLGRRGLRSVTLSELDAAATQAAPPPTEQTPPPWSFRRLWFAQRRVVLL